VEPAPEPAPEEAKPAEAAKPEEPKPEEPQGEEPKPEEPAQAEQEQPATAPLTDVIGAVLNPPSATEESAAPAEEPPAQPEALSEPLPESETPLEPAVESGPADVAEEGKQSEPQIADVIGDALKPPAAEEVQPTVETDPDFVGLMGLFDSRRPPEAPQPETPDAPPPEEVPEETSSAEEDDGSPGLAAMFEEMRRCFKDDNASPDYIVALIDGLDIKPKF
jgi:hypothetical protein